MEKDELKRISDVARDIDNATSRLKINELQKRHDELTAASRQPGFWDDSSKAGEIMKQVAKLEARIKPWTSLGERAKDLCDLAKLDDPTLSAELNGQLDKLERDFDDIKEQLKFNGPYDDHDAIVSLYAGAGGTDAQDWTQMLLRMYSRYIENSDWKMTTLEESSGEEAGLKSITLDVEGPFAYGKLKGEHGVHRLVRLSPFNSDNLRQTSFAKVEVIPKIDKPDEMVIDDKDLKIDVYRSGGHGGQSVNTTDSAVRATHLPTGLSVAIQNERSQLQNKETAMTILRSRLAGLQLEQHAEKLNELKGPNQSAEWGNQIRSYVLHPYKQVKDLRTGYETSDTDKVLDGQLEPLIQAYLEHTL